MSSSSSTRGASSAEAAEPLAFPEPKFCSAQRIHGLVDTSDNDNDDDEEAQNQKLKSDDSQPRGPPSLCRRHSVSGNVLVLDHPEHGRKAFLLQRKVATTAYGGSVRVGFCLDGDKPGDDGFWKVLHKENSECTHPSASRKRDHEMMMGVRDRYEMVTICIETESRLLGVKQVRAQSMADTTSTLKTELAAIQYIGALSKTMELDHLWGTDLIGNDCGSICVVMSPWHSHGTLLDLCNSYPNGILPLEEAKFFFRQIAKGMQQLRMIGVCHRSISLDTVMVEDRHCRLSHYGSALRIPTTSDGASTSHLITPQPVGGRYPESVAPELWAQQEFDGYAVDVWSAGILLWKMLVTKVDLFVAAVPDDFRFRDYCLEGKMKDRLKPAALPDEVVDLLEGMLRVDPSDRFTADDIVGHSWLAE